MMFPLVLANTADAAVALNRISKFLTAEELDEPYTIDYNRNGALDVDGDFSWEAASNYGDQPVKGGGGTCSDETKKPKENVEQISEMEKHGLFRRGKRKQGPVLPTTACSETCDDVTQQEGEEE